jgi:hypothetical protein
MEIGVDLQCGNLIPIFSESASVEEALASANRGKGVAWIGVVEPTYDELAQLGRALGASDQSLAEIEHRGTILDLSAPSATKQPKRACADVLDGVVHLLLRGPARDSSGNLSLDGDVELLATRTAVVVASRGLAPDFQPEAILRLIEKSFDASRMPRAADIAGLVISLASV